MTKNSNIEKKISVILAILLLGIEAGFSSAVMFLSQTKNNQLQSSVIEYVVNYCLKITTTLFFSLFSEKTMVGELNGSY